jgi:hypothetical protein
MRNLLKSLFVIAICAMPLIAMAQPESCKVKYTGNKPTIKDFARAYCSQCDEGSFEREALAAFTKGNSKLCVVDSKNGYVKYTAKQDDALETIEMCFWNCDNKNEKLVAVNRVSDGMGFDESFLNFYRYNVKTKTMKLIEMPFDREPQPVDMLNKAKASKKIINEVKSAQNEDANKYQPCYQLPHVGKNITFRMADQTAVPKAMQRQGTMVWNGSSFKIDK